MSDNQFVSIEEAKACVKSGGTAEAYINLELGWQSIRHATWNGSDFYKAGAHFDLSTCEKFRITKPAPVAEYPKSCNRDEAIACVRDGGKAQLRGMVNEKWHDLCIKNSCVGYNRCGEHETELLLVWHYRITEPAIQYPRSCTVKEAMRCVMSGGKAQVHGMAEDEFRDLKIRDGFTGIELTNGAFMSNIPDAWIARILKPAPAKEEPTKPVTVSTVDAIAELYRSKPGEIEFTGEHSVYSQLTLFLCNTSTAQLKNWNGTILDCIPNTTWVRNVNKPAPLHLGDDVGIGHEPMPVDDLIVEAVNQLRQSWSGTIRITCTVEAVD